MRSSRDWLTIVPAVAYTYDPDSLLTGAGALSITRDPASGFVTGTTLGSVTDAMTYNSYGEPQTYSASFGTTALYSVDYGNRDGLGRIVTKTETVQGVSHTYGYSYDAVGRLTDVTQDGVATSPYVYDANGNRIDAPGLTSSPAYDAQDRLLSYGNCTYAYKADGSLQTKTCGTSTTTYDYDAFGNLRHVTLPAGTNIDYVIDGQNRRVGKKVNGVLVEGLLYRSQIQPVAWLDGTGVVKATFVYGLHPNVPEYVVQGATTYRVITDQIGSARLVVNTATGAVAEHLDYDEFGNVVSDTMPGTQPFGFAGGLRDPDTGLVRFGARDYDPVPGRWTVKDPLVFRGGAANLFAYVHNDSIGSSDPGGLADKSGPPLPGCTSTYDCCLSQHTGDPEACGGSPDDFRDKFNVKGPEQPNPIDPKDIKPQVQCEPQPLDIRPKVPGLGCKGEFDVAIGFCLTRTTRVGRAACASLALGVWLLCMARPH